MATRFNKIVKDALHGLKEGLFNGLLLGGLIESLPDKVINKSAFFQATTKPEKDAPRSLMHTVGTTTVLSGAVGLVIGICKGIFGKQEKGQDATLQSTQQLVDDKKVPSQYASEQQPQQSPEMFSQKSHAAGMEPKESHSQGMSAQNFHEETASRPKETVLTR